MELTILIMIYFQAMGFYWGGWGWGGFPLNDWRIYGGRWGLGAGHGGIFTVFHVSKLKFKV